jgi:hypothetical protein
MNNNQKMLLGVAVVGVAAYYYWKSQQPKPAAKMVGQDGSIFKGRPNGKVFANVVGNQQSCGCHKGTVDAGDGDIVYVCQNGNKSFNTAGPCKGKGQK